jgi:hypothetical protein
MVRDGFLITFDDGRGLSSITDVDRLPIFSALDLYIVFGLHDREAAVRSARPQAGQKLL